MGNAFGSNSSSSKQDGTALVQAAIGADLKELKSLIENLQSKQCEQDGGDNSVVDIGQFTDPAGNSALHGAVFGGHLEITKYLFEDESCKADMFHSNDIGCNAVWLAAGYGRADILLYLFSRLREQPHDKDTELSLQSSAVKDRVAKALSAANNSGDSAFLAACSKGNLEACKILLDQADKFDLKSGLLEARNQNRDLPISVAISAAQQQQGGDVEDLIDLLLQEISSTPHILNEPNQKGLTPVLVSCEQDNVALLRKLLSAGASLDVQDSTGSSPLAVAAFCGCADTVKELLLPVHRKVELPLLDHPNATGCTPLWLATRCGRDEICKLLLEAGANPAIADKKEQLTPLDVARKYKRETIVKLLEEREAPKDASSSR